MKGKRKRKRKGRGKEKKTTNPTTDDYSYFTDEAGRVNKVSGELKLETKDRNIYQQGKSVEIKDGVRGKDQGGHIIARIFNGPGERKKG